MYVVSAVLHPWTPPHETAAAFQHYAAEPMWALIHLGELLGILLMSVTGLALTWRLRGGVAGVWACLAGAAMIVFAAVYAVFIAVDGVAVGTLARRWTSATVERQELLFETAFAVRQVEAGLFALQWLMFGIAAGLFSVAFFASARTRSRSAWLNSMAWLSVLASLGTLSFAVVQAQTGFSPLSMAFQTGLYAGVLWIVAVGVFLFSNPAEIEAAESRQPQR